MRTLKIDRFTLLLLAVSGMGSMLLLLRMATYGIDISGDAHRYISTAESLLNGDGFTNWTGSSYAGASPLYPIILAAFGSFGLDIIEIAEYVNTVAFGLTIFVIAIWLRSRVRSRFLVVWAACACALSTSLAEFSAKAGTEIVFIFFVCCSLFAMDQFLGTGKKSLLIWAAVGASGALLTRYMGLALVGSGLLLLIPKENVQMRRRLSNVIVWCTVSIAPFSVWAIRNILTVESLFGPIYPGNFLVIDSVHNITSQIALWIFGSTGLNFLGIFINHLTGITIGYPTIAAVILTSATLAYTAIGFGIVLIRYRPGAFRRNREIFSICISLILVYCLVLIIERPLSNATLSIRYLIPLFPPLLATVTVVFNEFIQGPFVARLDVKRTSKIKLASTSVILLAFLWLALQVIPNYNSIVSWNNNGRGYRSSEWAESQVIEHLNNKPIDGVIWSNEHAALYFLTKSQDAEIYRLPLDLVETRSRISTNHYADNKNYIVWFYWDFYHTLPDYSLKDLDKSLGLKVEAILKDGYIFRVGPGPMNTSIPLNNRIVSSLLANTHLIISSYFNVYIDHEHHRLIYIRYNTCSSEDIHSEFMLRIFPADSANYLTTINRRTEFNDLGFSFAENVIPIDDYCVAIRSLPSYDIMTIQTAQGIKGENDIWKGEYRFQ